MPFATAHCVLVELAFAICGDARAQLGATIASKTIIARSQHNCQPKLLIFIGFASSIDAVRAKMQPVRTYQLVTDAVHIALHRIADGVAVQVAVVAGLDAILF